MFIQEKLTECDVGRRCDLNGKPKHSVNRKHGMTSLIWCAGVFLTVSRQTTNQARLDFCIVHAIIYDALDFYYTFCIDLSTVTKKRLLKGLTFFKSYRAIKNTYIFAKGGFLACKHFRGYDAHRIA